MDEAQEKCKRRTLFMLRMRKIVNNRIRGESHGENDVQIKGGSKEKVFVGVARFPTSKDKRTFSLRGGSKEKDFVGPARFPTSKDSFSFGRKRKGKKKGKREKDLRARPLQKKTREWREEHERTAVRRDTRRAETRTTQPFTLSSLNPKKDPPPNFFFSSPRVREREL